MKIAATIVVAVLCGLPGPVFSAPDRAPKAVPPDPKVKRAVQAGINYLRTQQLADGSWEVDMLSATFQGGWTSLALLALLNARVSTQDKMIQKGLAYLEKLESKFTYVRALQTAVFAKADRKKYAELIQRKVDWLVKARVKEGNDLLGWTYTNEGRQLTDNSNTQYALLGLHAGQLAGAKVPKEIWKEIHEFYLRTQNGNGGFGYNRGNVDSSLTMTAAGLCGMLISGEQLKIGRAKLLKDPKVQKAVALIGKDFTAQLKTRVYYNLYGLARAGRLSGLKSFGNHDWYHEGCQLLVRQQGVKGEWPAQAHFDQWPVINTSYALLFLVK
jgi:hypothetical protein